MELSNLLNNFISLYETKSNFSEYKVTMNPTYNRSYKKVRMSGMKATQKKELELEIDIAVIAFRKGSEIDLPPKFSCHEWSQSDASKGYIFGDFHLSYGYVVKWMKYLNKPEVEFVDIGNHANTRAA